jgi:RNA-directed DNA polymerase
LAGVRKAAKENKEMKFTALLHHLTIELLRESIYSLKRKAARPKLYLPYSELQAIAML